MDEYFACCDGVKLPGGERLYSVDEMLEVDAPGFFPITDDGCGGFDLVAARFEVGPGAVVAWDHESQKVTIAVSSSLSLYVERLAISKIAVAKGKKDPMPKVEGLDMESVLEFHNRLRAHLEKYDSAVLSLLDSPRFAGQLGRLEVRYTKTARRPDESSRKRNGRGERVVAKRAQPSERPREPMSGSHLPDFTEPQKGTENALTYAASLQKKKGATKLAALLTQQRNELAVLLSRPRDENHDQTEAVRKKIEANLEKLDKAYEDTGISFVREGDERAGQDVWKLGAVFSFEDQENTLESIVELYNRPEAAFVHTIFLEGASAEDLERVLQRNWPSLVVLDLRANPIGPDGVRALAALKPLRRLAGLNLELCGIGLQGVRILATSDNLKSLAALNLNTNGIGADGARALAASESARGLSVLDLAGNQVGDKGIQALAASDNLKGLTTLNLAANDIHDDGVQALAASENLVNLVELRLSGNEIGTKGARALAASKNLGRLATLYLSMNNIGPGGAQALAASKNLESLTTLCLDFNDIRTKGAQALAASKNLGSLTRLDLVSNSIDSASYSTLQKAFEQRGVNATFVSSF